MDIGIAGRFCARTVGSPHRRTLAIHDGIRPSSRNIRLTTTSSPALSGLHGWRQPLIRAALRSALG